MCSSRWLILLLFSVSSLSQKSLCIYSWTSYWPFPARSQTCPDNRFLWECAESGDHSRDHQPAAGPASRGEQVFISTAAQVAAPGSWSVNCYETYWAVTVFMSSVELLADPHPSQAVCSSGHGQTCQHGWETGCARIGMASKLHCRVRCAKAWDANSSQAAMGCCWREALDRHSCVGQWWMCIWMWEAKGNWLKLELWNIYNAHFFSCNYFWKTKWKRLWEL